MRMLDCPVSVSNIVFKNKVSKGIGEGYTLSCSQVRLAEKKHNAIAKRAMWAWEYTIWNKRFMEQQEN